MPTGQPIQLPHDIYDASLLTRPWWHFLLLALVAAALAFVVWRVWRAVKRRKSRPGRVQPIGPWDELTARLAAHVPPEPFPVGRTQEDYYVSLSLLLREAVERRTKIPATDLTVPELRRPLRDRLPLAPADTEAVLAFLDRADLVKFAGQPSDLAEALAFHARACDWLRALTPRSTEANPWEQSAAGQAASASPTSSSPAGGVAR